MPSKLNTLFWSFLACTVVVAQEARIHEAIPFENGTKTSLAIAFKGSEKLSYFALDATKGVLTLDLPGVYSDVDFSQLQFAQVRAITQVPLNPDSSEGISISFFLREGVVYSIFEGSPSELIIFFEDGMVEETIVKTPLVTMPELTLNSGQDIQISGKSGPGRLAAVHVETVDQLGLIRLVTTAGVETRNFYLSGPRRFVLDLKGTICSLDHDLITLNSPLVKQIRVRQFQVEPSPVTRMVLDLETRTEVRISPSVTGLLVAFGPDELSVEALLNQGKFPIAEPGLANAFTQPVEHQPELLPADSDAIPQAEFRETLVESTGTPKPNLEEAMIQPLVAAETDPEPTLVEELATRQAATQWELSNDNIEQTIENEQPMLAEVAQGAGSTPVETNAETQVIAKKLAAENAPLSEQMNSAQVPLPVVENQAPVVEDQKPLVTELEEKPLPKVVADMESGALDESNREIFQNFQERSGNKDNTVTFTVDVPLTNDFAAIDRELDGFLDPDAEKTPYNLLRHADLKRTASQGPILMNNITVAKANNQLAAMAPLQEGEVGTDPDDLESIFAIPEADDNFETLSGSRKQYRGFEIDSIDVKNVQVIDLLRFLASQINVNLYIDSSVSSNLTATYKFTNMPWDLILDMILKNANLDKEFSHGVLRVATVEKFRREAEQRRELLEQRELAVPVETVHIPLSYAKAADVEAIVRNYLSPRGLILRDDRTNTLIIEDIPKRMLSIRALIKKLDKMISQVTIEARIVETTKRFLRELGIQWGLSAQYSPEIGTDTGLTFPNRVGVGGPTLGSVSRFNGLQGGYAVNFPVVDENPSGIGLSFGNFLDNFKLDISLQMLEDEGRGRIISAPKITTQNNKTATIENGQRIPIQTIQRGTVTIRYIDATLSLLVTPHITADETIIMDIVVDKSEPDFTRTVAGNPVINIRKADTRVLVKNGGTAVIGGIFTINEQSSNRGIPKLRSVPILRRLFSSDRVEYTNQELLIFVTPRIVKY